ncbi:MAG: class I SAM-dependent methyltransferase [Planctomycetes bacterium]|nr:class I SAM-dependent methyltransferase [Planctomycetota bacterium]
MQNYDFRGDKVSPEIGQIGQILRQARNYDQQIRLIHGRGGNYPGLEFLTVDYYQPILVVYLHHHRDLEWCAALKEELEGNFPFALIQDRSIKKAAYIYSWGEPKEEHIAEEDGLKYHVAFSSKSQNCGFFPDMHVGRTFLSEISHNCKVLNLFAYTCSLSVAALKGGALHVDNMDLSSLSLSIGRNNHRLNEMPLNQVSFFKDNIMKSFGKLRKKGPYDIVILDPPTFQKGSFDVERDYAKILRRMPDFIRKGGLVLACLNSPHHDNIFLRQLFEQQPGFVFQRNIQQSAEFPEKNPEAGLKMQLYHYME